MTIDRTGVTFHPGSRSGPVARHTWCEYVFNSVFIDRNGEVFACCHKQPRRYGNIHTATLADILARRPVAEQQAMSREGALTCFAGCNLLQFTRKASPSEGLSSTYPRIAKLTLALGWFCNVDCVMCPQDHHERVFLPVETLREHVDWSSVGEIICEGGEPLAAPTAQTLWDVLIGLGKKVNFVTNGLIMTPRLACKMVRHSDYVSVSFNAATAETYERVVRGGSWRRLLRGIRLLQDARVAEGSSFRIIGHFTIVRDNLFEVPAFLDVAAALGLDIVNFGYNRIAHMGACIDRVLADDTRLRDRLAADTIRACRRVQGQVLVDVSRLQYLGLVQPSDPLSALIVHPSGM